MRSEMVCILDRSGSMYGWEQDVIENFNQMVEEQKAVKGEAYLTASLFSDQCRMLYRHRPLGEVPPLTRKIYYTGGNTALLDAIGETLAWVDEGMIPASADQVLILILTDGLENASVKYTEEEIQKLLLEKQERGWRILFWGTDRSILKQARRLGMKREETMLYTRDSEGIRAGYKTAGKCFMEMREKSQ